MSDLPGGLLPPIPEVIPLVAGLVAMWLVGIATGVALQRAAWPRRVFADPEDTITLTIPAGSTGPRNLERQYLAEILVHAAEAVLSTDGSITGPVARQAEGD